MREHVVLEIYDSSFSATLTFSNNKLISFSIEYNGDDDNFIIKGADDGISISLYHYISEKIGLLKDFNEKIIEKSKEKKKEISESEAKQLLLELLDYVNNVTEGETIRLIDKVKNAVKARM